MHTFSESHKSNDMVSSPPEYSTSKMYLPGGKISASNGITDGIGVSKLDIGIGIALLPFPAWSVMCNIAGSPVISEILMV